MEGVSELGMVGAGAGTGGGGPESVTEFLYCRDTAGPPLRGGVVGFDRENGICPGRLPGQGSQAADRMAAPSGERWKMVLPLPGRGSKGAGIVRVGTSILRRQNTVAQFIATRPSLGVCEVEERRQVTRVPRRWWEYTGWYGCWDGRGWTRKCHGSIETP